MKKALSLLLALVLCLSLCACGGGNTDTTNPTNGEASNPNTDTNTSTDNTTENNAEQVVDYTSILCNDTFWSQINGMGMLYFNTDGTTGTSKSGTWSVDGNTLTLTTKAGNKEIDEIKIINDVCFLIGDTYTYRDPRPNKNNYPVKSVEITMDNWQEYFEFATKTRETVVYDVFGEPTGEVEVYEIKVLAVKDEHFCALLPGRSEVALRYSIGGEEQEAKLDDICEGNGIFYFGISNITNEEDTPFEMIKIQGTLCFVDGI